MYETNNADEGLAILILAQFLEFWGALFFGEAETTSKAWQEQDYEIDADCRIVVG